jgi:hypothetical protein
MRSPSWRRSAFSSTCFSATPFVFQNKPASLGIDIPARGGAIPIEEFVFYLTGFMLVLLSYIWCDEYWMSAYNIPDYEAATKGMSRIVRFHFASVILGLVLIVGAVVYRKSSRCAGFLVLIYLTCSSLFPRRIFKTAQSFINRIQFHFPSALISLLGSDACSSYAGAISRRGDDRSEGRCVVDLPIEAACVWMAVSHSCDRLRSDQDLESFTGALSAFFGKADPPWLTVRELRPALSACHSLLG